MPDLKIDSKTLLLNIGSIWNFELKFDGDVFYYTTLIANKKTQFPLIQMVKCGLGKLGRRLLEWKQKCILEGGKTLP